MPPRLSNVRVAPDRSAAEVAELLTVDSARAASTRRLASAAYVSSGGRADSVAGAAIRLGQRELYRVS
jgi:HD-like signal output (HDOD) protein